MDFSHVDIAQLGIGAIFLLLLIGMSKWTGDKMTKILDNNREDINNERKEFIVALTDIATRFENEVREVRMTCRQEQGEMREVLVKMTEELRKVGDVLLRHEVALEKLLEGKQ